MRDDPERMRSVARCLTANESKAEAAAKHLLESAASQIDKLKAELAEAVQLLDECDSELDGFDKYGFRSRILEDQIIAFLTNHRSTT